MIIALDFDGTLATHEWPEIGEDIGAFPKLISLKEKYPDVRYLLWTVRSGRPLAMAIEYCQVNGIDFWGINKNPTQYLWSPSNKAHAHAYVDDAAIGAPLTIPKNIFDRPYINWNKMIILLERRVKHYFAIKRKHQ